MSNSNAKSTNSADSLSGTNVGRDDLIKDIRKVSAPIIADLAKLGYRIDWISDLYSKRIKYQSAIPVLLQWLQLVDNVYVKETIVRALSVPWAKPQAASILVKEFIKAGPGYTSLKWAIGNALSIVADDAVFSEIVNLAQDHRHGKSREMIVLALGNMSEPQAEDVLIKLLNDNEVVGHAIMALGKLKSVKAYPELEKLLSFPKPWIRKEAKRALSRIDKVKAKQHRFQNN